MFNRTFATRCATSGGATTTTLLLLTVLLGAGCGGGSQDPAESPDAQPGDVATEMASSDPAPEGTGAEPPAPARDGAPALKIASLPVGGGAEDDSTTEQCVSVSWLGRRMPDGVSVLVTDVRIRPSGVFTRSGSGCGGPGCESSFSFTADRDTCTVAVTATGRPGAAARLSVNGRPQCSAEQEEWCRDLDESGGKSIRLTVPGEPETGGEDTDPGGEGTDPGDGTDPEDAATSDSTG
jgi:hypothetical protein